MKKLQNKQVRCDEKVFYDVPWQCLEKEKKMKEFFKKLHEGR